MPAFTIVHAKFPEDLEIVRSLVTAYTTWLNVDLTFQNYAAEMAGLPGKYAAPAGRILLARSNSSEQMLGCVLLRPLGTIESYGNCCEMKRLYVLPEGRGLGIGKELSKQAIEEAKKIGYEYILLDSLSRMTSALAVHEENGFKRCGAYYFNPHETAIFMARDLRDGKCESLVRNGTLLICFPSIAIDIEIYHVTAVHRSPAYLEHSEHDNDSKKLFRFAYKHANVVLSAQVCPLNHLLACCV